MATINAYGEFNADTFANWDLAVGYFDPIFVSITTADSHLQYWSGSGFSMDSAWHLVGGTANTIEDHFEGLMPYRITDLAHSVAAIDSYLQAGDSQGLMAYIFNGNDVFIGAVENDAVNGYAGNDSLTGSRNYIAFPGTDDDTLAGGAGNDTINGGGGNDSLIGGAGIDLVSYQGEVGASSGVTVRLTATGPQSTGGAGIDTLSGFEGLTGSDFADKLTGSNLHNAMKGLAGADTLIGRGGNDTLAGGAGADSFVFNVVLNGNTNVDRIADFSVAKDMMRLDNDVFTAFAKANIALTADAFRKGAGVSTAADAEDRIIYNATTGNLYYDADGNGTSSAAVLFATLTTHPDTVSAVNFFIVA